MRYSLENFDTKPNAEVNKETVVNKKASSKKKAIKPFYFIAAFFALVVVVLMVFLIFLSNINNPLNNTWLHKSQDGNDYYYTFTEDSDACVLEISIGTDYFMCDYEITDDNTITISYSKGQIYTDNFIGKYTYEISEKDGKQVLTLTNFDGTKNDLLSTEKPSDDEYIKPYDNYKINEDILGKWKIDYSLGTLRLEINDDGSLIMNLLDAERQHYVYTTTDTTIKMAFYKSQLNEFEEPYQLVDGKLKFLGVEWIKDE